MSVYLQYVPSAARRGVCNKGNVKRSQLLDKTQQMHLHSQQQHLNA